jgi:hypothetical protein
MLNCPQKLTERVLRDLEKVLTLNIATNLPGKDKGKLVSRTITGKFE